MPRQNTSAKGRCSEGDWKLQEALAEFRLAAEIDPSNFEALGRNASHHGNHPAAGERAKENRQERTPGSRRRSRKRRRTPAGPVALDIKWDTPISLHLTSTTVDVVYKTIAKIAGINVLMDPDYKPQKINFELQDVDLRQAMEMIAMQSKTFWRPVSINTIMVAADTGSKRKELEQNVMKTFYLKNAASPADLQQAAGTLKAHSRYQPHPGHAGTAVADPARDARPDGPGAKTADRYRQAQSRSRGGRGGDGSQQERHCKRSEPIRPPVRRLRWRRAVMTSGSGTGSGSGLGWSGLTMNSFTHLTAGDFPVSIPGISFSLLATDSHTKVLQRPEIRVLDSEKASLKIGDRVPIATGSFQSGFGGSVNTQFQYLDVGVNIDITPYVHAGNEVTLKMSLEISSVTGVQSIGGFNQPTIGQRRIEHQARLKDGEVNLIAGILNDSETKSLSGYPGLIKVPILKYFFGQDSKQRQENEIVFAIIPHIVRGYDTNEDNLKEVDLGSGTTVTYRKAGAK